MHTKQQAKEIAKACLLISDVLAWGDENSQKKINATCREIIIALNGQLRYPYVLELLSFSQIKDIVSRATSDPYNFAKVLKNPGIYFSSTPFQIYIDV